MTEREKIEEKILDLGWWLTQGDEPPALRVSKHGRKATAMLLYGERDDVYEEAQGTSVHAALDRLWAQLRATAVREMREGVEIFKQQGIST
jgi:ribosome-associated translation inhibitor RaiA